jgi:hypothetical protein
MIVTCAMVVTYAMVPLAACAAQKPSPDYAATIVRLDQARAEIAPPLGATTYTLGRRRLLNLPGGENASLRDSLLELPGVSYAPDGQVSVRDQ